MQFAIFDTGPGFLQWMGEASDPLEAIKELHAESNEYDNDEQDPTEPFIAVYQLTDQEVTLLNELLSKGEHIYQDFNDEGHEFTLSQVRQIVGS